MECIYGLGCNGWITSFDEIKMSIIVIQNDYFFKCTEQLHIKTIS